MKKPARTLLVIVTVALFVPAWAAAATAARYVRVEAPTSGRMALLEIEVHSGGKNVARNDDVAISGYGFRGVPLPDPDRHSERELNDGKVNGRGLQASAPEGNHGVNPWVELDLGKAYPIDQIVIIQPEQPAYTDKYLRLVTLLDAGRKVVLAQTYDTRDRAVQQGKIALDANAKNSIEALLGQSVPQGANFWIAMSQVMSIVQTPPPADVAQRSARFAARNSPQSIEALAREFFALIDLSKPELAPVKARWDAADAQGALDAFRDHFFKKLNDAVYLRENRLGINYAGTKYPGQADDLLNGVLVFINPKGAFGWAYKPGAFNWTYIPQDAPESDRAEALSVIRSWAYVNSFAISLLQAYVATGETKYLDQWATVSDDWAMNFFRDADASPYNIRDYFPKDPLQLFYYMCYQLKEFSRQHPEFVRQMPSATLARLLMPIVEEYPAQYWRQARVLSFNHIFNAFEAAYPCSQILNDFYAGQRFEREVGQDFSRLWSQKMTRDGSMIEIGDEGHMPMSLSVARSFLDMTLAPPSFLTPQLRRRAENGIRTIYGYVLRNTSPGGYQHRYSDGDAFPIAWELTKNPQLFKGGEPVTAWIPTDFFAQPDVRAIYDTVFGRGSEPINDARKAAREQVAEYFKGEYQGPPKMVSDWMPYAGLFYLRGSWKPDAPFMHAIAQQPEHQSTNGQLWNTEFRFHDYGYPLVSGSPVLVDGQVQNPDYQRQTLDPGSKTSRISAAPQDPMRTRWHTSPAYDFAESYYQGAFQDVKGKRDRDWFRSPFTPGEPEPAGKAVEGVKATRQYIQVRPYRLFVIADRVELKDPAPHSYTVNYSFLSAQTPAQKKAADDAVRAAASAKKAAKENGEGGGRAAQAAKAPPAESAGALTPDASGQRIVFTNPASPGVTVYHFAADPVSYQDGNWRYPISFRGHVYPGVASGEGDSPRDVNIAGFVQESRSVNWSAKGNSALVTLLSSTRPGEAPRIRQIQPLKAAGAAGFHATMLDGGEVSYQTADRGTGRLALGNVRADAQALLLVRDAAGKTTGMIVGAKDLSIGGTRVQLPGESFEFALNGSQLADISPIGYPIVPVRVEPQSPVFTDAVQVTLSTPTPDVEIRYTTDGTEPTAASPLYTGPFTLNDSAQVMARAFAKGVTEIPFTTAGTDVSPISYGEFVKQPWQDAAVAAPLSPGLRYDYLEGTWFKLYSYADRMPATATGTTQRLLDVSARRTDGPFGMRYTGFLNVPREGVYTFHAPPEFYQHIAEPGYDLRLYVDGQEWLLGQNWQGMGQWSIPLRQGAHRLMVTFADARAKDLENQKSNAWAGFPRPWVIWRGTAPTIEVSGPDLARQPIPASWLFHQP